MAKLACLKQFNSFYRLKTVQLVFLLRSLIKVFQTTKSTNLIKIIVLPFINIYFINIQEI